MHGSVASGAVSVCDGYHLAFEAYTYGFAIVENYRAMFGMCVWEESPQYSGFNSFLHGRELFDSSYDTVVNANNDTLYSTTFADLRSEPLVISVPPTGDRYFVIQLVDMGTDNFAYIGTRATGTEGATFSWWVPTFKGRCRSRTLRGSLSLRVSLWRSPPAQLLLGRQILTR